MFDTKEEEDDGGSNSIVDGFGSWDSSNSWSVSSPNDAPIEEICHFLLHPDADVEDHHDDIDGDADGYGKGQVGDDKDDGGGDDDDGGGDGGDDDDDDGCDLDDELVPWNVNNKLGR